MGLSSTFSLHYAHLHLTRWCKHWQLFTYTCLELMPSTSTKCKCQVWQPRRSPPGNCRCIWGRSWRHLRAADDHRCMRQKGRPHHARAHIASHEHIRALKLHLNQSQSKGDEVRAGSQEPGASARESYSHVRGLCPYLEDTWKTWGRVGAGSRVDSHETQASNASTVLPATHVQSAEPCVAVRHWCGFVLRCSHQRYLLRAQGCLSSPNAVVMVYSDNLTIRGRNQLRKGASKCCMHLSAFRAAAQVAQGDRLPIQPCRRAGDRANLRPALVCGPVPCR